MLAVIPSNYATATDSNSHHRCERGGYPIENSYVPSPQQPNDLKAWSGLPQASAQQGPNKQYSLSVSVLPPPKSMSKNFCDAHKEVVCRYKQMPRFFRGATATRSPDVNNSKSRRVIRPALPTPDNLKSSRSPVATPKLDAEALSVTTSGPENRQREDQDIDQTQHQYQHQVQPEAKQAQQALRGVPTLINEKNRRAAFVEKLVDTAALTIEFVWSNFTINPSAKIIPLRVFLQETLRHSHTSYSTLQTALFYLFRIKPKITERALRSRRPLTPPAEGSTVGWNANHNNDPATCGRRMFLAALIVASKYLQDQSYNNKAWSTISGLTVQEINANEMEFLQLIDYNLFIGEDVFKRWNSLLLSHIQAISGFDVKNGGAFAQEEYQREKERFFQETLTNLDPKTMAAYNSYPWTPESSYPGSPL